MKKLAILFTTLVLGASSVAFADHTIAPNAYEPSKLRERDFDDNDGLRDHRGGWNRPRQRWTTLAESTIMQRGRTVIDVSSQRRFTKLALDANRPMFVDKVVIIFGNGERQVVDLNKRLGAHGAPAVIDLAGNSRMIDKVMVLGRGRIRASFTLKAM
jgi:hypothetical protein